FMVRSSTHVSLVQRVRLLALAGLIYLLINTSALSETFIESRYQYYQEDDDRIRVDSNYSLFSIDLNDTTVLSGSALYSAISGASPTGLPPLVKGGELPVAQLEDERLAFTLGLGHQRGSHLL